MELDFRGCSTRADVEKVFDDKEVFLESEKKNLNRVRELFFEEETKEVEET